LRQSIPGLRSAGFRILVVHYLSLDAEFPLAYTEA
jgi:hypothetical protein